MSVNAGQILTVGGRTVLQRVQDAGLGDVRIPIETVREIGNPLVVDKIPQEPEFTFTMQSLDVSCDLEAMLQGKTGPAGASPTTSAGASQADPAGTEYRWQDCVPINLVSPWKESNNSAASGIAAGHIIPNYYPTRLRYTFGVTDNAQQECELAGGAFYYGKFPPVEEYAAGTGAQTDYPTSSAAIHYRKGGVSGSSFKSVFGVLVDGVPMIDGVDYVVTGGADGPGGSTAHVIFTTAPVNGAKIRYAYFTAAAIVYPPAVHRDAIVQPGAVRGRNICLSVATASAGAPTHGSAAWQKIGSVQSAQLEATVASVIEREFCNEEQVGRTVNGFDVVGQVVIRSRDAAAFFQVLKQFTGLDTDKEVVGFLNQNQIQMKIEIQNPKNPAVILKTLYVPDAIFTIPGTPAKVNTPTDFTVHYDSQTGDYSAFKGAMA